MNDAEGHVHYQCGFADGAAQMKQALLIMFSEHFRTANYAASTASERSPLRPLLKAQEDYFVTCMEMVNDLKVHP